MAISFSSAVGNLFNRLGKLGNLIKQVRSYQSSQEANMINTLNGVVAQFNGESDLQALMGNSYLGILRGPESASTTAQNIARATINRVVFRDNPRSGQDLQSQNILGSLTEVIRQMKLAGSTVRAMTITATPTSFSGTGNGIVNSSVIRPLDGLTLENAFAETLLLTCSSDSYSGSSTAGNEPIFINGTGAQSDVYAFNWPQGSGSQTTLNAIDGNVNNGSGNLLTNSGFANFTLDVPNNFTLVVGAGNTNLFEETSIVYDGAKALRIAGDGPGTLTEFKQKFGDSTAGTSDTLDPQTQYSFNLFARRDGTAAAAGILTVDLIDGNGTVIQDAAGVANTFNIDLTALTTQYASFTGVFRTPVILPASQFLRFRLSTALTNGRSVYLDKCSLGIMRQLYTSGPFLAVHAGSTPFLIGDFATVVITNSRGSGGTLDTFQTLFARIFSEMLSNELLLPSSSSPSVDDALIG